MGWRIVYLLVTMIVCVIMASNGFGLNTWQYWVVLACMLLANLAGYGVGVEEDA